VLCRKGDKAGFRMAVREDGILDYNILKYNNIIYYIKAGH